MWEPSTPLTEAEFAATLKAIGGFERPPLIAVAVSGGPDSLALIILADRWARRHGGQAWALHVDHGLRPESISEAGVVAGWLGARGIPHALLAWTGDKPRSGIQEAAREARYRLLAEWCRERGCLHLLTGHHREDQIETHLIRRRAASGIDGLAGMPAVRELHGCRLVRPLLGVSKARLAAVLEASGQPFLRDPSNRNPIFERARLRSAATTVANNKIADDVLAYGERRIAREHALNALLARAVALHPAGFAILDRAALAGVADEAVERLLGRVAACIGGARYTARRARLQRLRAGFTAAPERARTLGGCRFVPWRGRILVLREAAAASPPAYIRPGTRVTWDRRFAAELSPAAPGGFVLGHLGQNHRAAAQDYDGELPRLVHSVLPAFWDGEGLLAAVPHLGYRRCNKGEIPRLSFSPANPLAPAGFTVV
jgi:tRNA(Ile)-lysidine synthase